MYKYLQQKSDRQAQTFALGFFFLSFTLLEQQQIERIDQAPFFEVQHTQVATLALFSWIRRRWLSRGNRKKQRFPNLDPGVIA